MFLHLVIITIISFCVFDYWKRKRRNDLMKNIPLVPCVPIFGSIFHLMSFLPENLHLKFSEYFNRYGKTFRAWIFESSIVVTADVNLAGKILNNNKCLSKRIPYFLLLPWLGNGLLLSNGEKWKNMRKILTPTFHFKILEEFVEVFDRQSTILIEKLRPLADGQQNIDIYPIMCLATLDTIAETAMGVTINAQIHSNSDFVKALKDVTSIMTIRFMRPYLAFREIFKTLSPNLYRKQNEGIATMHSFTDDIIAKKRSILKKLNGVLENPTDMDLNFGIKKRMALLDVLLQSKVNGEWLTDREIGEEVNTFMFAGHDTVTSALSFTLWLLSRHKDVQQRLFEEIRDCLNVDLHRQIRYQDLQNMNYLSCVVKESLRLYPPIPAIGRYLNDNLQMDDINIPAGTNVFIILWEILRDPKVYPNPDLFKPERYTMENQSLSNPFSYIPFSAGPRNCIGQRFALLEMKYFIVKILCEYELVSLGENLQPSIAIVLTSKNGVIMGMRPRSL